MKLERHRENLQPPLAHAMHVIRICVWLANVTYRTCRIMPTQTVYLREGCLQMREVREMREVRDMREVREATSANFMALLNTKIC